MRYAVSKARKCSQLLLNRNTSWRKKWECEEQSGDFCSISLVNRLHCDSPYALFYFKETDIRRIFTGCFIPYSVPIISHYLVIGCAEPPPAPVLLAATAALEKIKKEKTG